MKKVWGWTQFVLGVVGIPICLWLAIMFFMGGKVPLAFLLLAFTVGGGLLIRDGWKLSHPKGDRVD